MVLIGSVDLSVVAVPAAVLLSAFVVCMTAAAGFGAARQALNHLRGDVTEARARFVEESALVRGELVRLRSEALNLIRELQVEHREVDRRLVKLETRLEQ